MILTLTTFHLIIMIITTSANSQLEDVNKSEIISYNNNMNHSNELSTIPSIMPAYRSLNADNGVVARTFGRIKKLQMGLLPVMFKLGVMATIIVMILFLSMKSVFIGIVLLIINFGFIVAKLSKLKLYESHHEDHHHGWQPTWQPPWSSPQPHHHAEDKQIHVHIHNPGPTSSEKHYSSNNEPYGAYSNSPPFFATSRSAIDENGSYYNPPQTAQQSNKNKYPYTVDYDNDRNNQRQRRQYIPTNYRKNYFNNNYAYNS